MNILIRNFKEADINFTTNLINKNFSSNNIKTELQYKNILLSHNKFCLIAEDENKNRLGFIKFSIQTKDYLKNKYNKASLYIDNMISDNVLYLEELIVKREFRNKGIASRLLLKAIKIGIENKCNIALAFAVKDGINGNINSEKLLSKNNFENKALIKDLWNQSKDNINYCPICKGHYNICKCEGIVFVKHLQM
jgi:ribosomal protein S18 acetylase RimI-like enzyme